MQRCRRRRRGPWPCSSADVLDAAGEHDREENQRQRAADVDEDLHRGEEVCRELDIEPAMPRKQPRSATVE